MKSKGTKRRSKKRTKKRVSKKHIKKYKIPHATHFIKSGGNKEYIFREFKLILYTVFEDDPQMQSLGDAWLATKNAFYRHHGFRKRKLGLIGARSLDIRAKLRRYISEESAVKLAKCSSRAPTSLRPYYFLQFPEYRSIFERRIPATFSYKTFYESL
jgi:hypothetical protein